MGDTFSKVLHGCFSRFLYCANGTKSRKASHIPVQNPKLVARMCSVKKDILENFVKFTRKHLCWSLFFNKITDLQLAILLEKRLRHKCFPFEFCKIYKNTFFIEHLRVTAF